MNADQIMDTEQTMRTIGKILAVTVLLDKRERDAEMVEFCHAIMSINQRLRPGVILPRSMILSWFAMHKPEIKTALAADADDSYKTSLLKSLKDEGLRRTVLAAIFTISVCDYELRDEEADFIKIALRVWKNDLPNASELELMAG